MDGIEDRQVCVANTVFQLYGHKSRSSCRENKHFYPRWVRSELRSCRYSKAADTAKNVPHSTHWSFDGYFALGNGARGETENLNRHKDTCRVRTKPETCLERQSKQNSRLCGQKKLNRKSLD